MANTSYREDELVSNRATLLIHGGSDSDRRAWAEEAAAHFPGETLTMATDAAQLVAALGRTHGVVYVPDAIAVGFDAQAQLTRALIEREEKPKFVLSLPTPVADAVAKGLLRDDLAFRLQHAVVDLSTPGLRDAIRARRNKAEGRGSSRAKPKKARVAPKPRKASRPAKKAAKRKR
jgi:hypothetical protein